MLLPGCLLSIGTASAAVHEETRVKRQAVFELTEKPGVSRKGDYVTIKFASRAYCDATVTIEKIGGDIAHHPGSGVLGSNAPEPFAKNSLKQVIVWDGKDDQGRYGDNRRR